MHILRVKSAKECYEKSMKSAKLRRDAAIFTAELYAILEALEFIDTIFK